jgi:hypothetical protein
MRATTKLLLLTLCSVSPEAVGGQSIPIRQLSAPEAVAPGKFDYATAIRPLSNGNVVVAARRQVLFFPPSLANPAVILDSTSSTLGRPVGQMTVIIPALGDTTWIVDVNASGFLIIEPNGKLGRAIAAPKANDIRLLSASLGNSLAVVDDKGRLIYRGDPPRVAPVASATGRTDIILPDSYPIVRADFESRTVDTIAMVSMPAGVRGSMTSQDGRMTMYMVQNPYPTTNAYTVLRDGTVVVAIGSDYHLDWIANGKTISTPKMPFDWKRIADEEKVRIIDSLTKLTAARDSASAASATRAAPNTIITRRSWVKPNELPDYFPPIRNEFVSPISADPEGNIWVLPTTSAAAQGGLLYDVINRQGVVFERIQLPKDCALGGIGPRGAVYLLCTTTGLERRRVLR